MNKCVNGKMVPMTEEEIAELNSEIVSVPNDPICEMAEALSKATTLSAMRAAAKKFLEVKGL